PPIRLQLRFAGTSGADAAAQLRHLDASTSQARQEIFKLGQFYLQLTFARSRMASKNVENQLRAIDDTCVDLALNVSLLRCRDVVIENDEVGRHRSCCDRNLFQLAFAN